MIEQIISEVAMEIGLTDEIVIIVMTTRVVVISPIGF
jgi:hypothetical protein